MENLASRLNNLHEAGVYRINCALSDVRIAASEAGFTVFDADLSGVHSKGEFLATVAQSILAPDWLHKNWDALADVLGDLSWQPAPGYVLVLRNGGDMLNLGASDHEIAAEILGDAVAYWKTQGKPFWVFFC
ncbi:MAG TPA: barstar family protein [Gallionella sp.]|nr:barstar family protein [Gallionella sp.]